MTGKLGPDTLYGGIVINNTGIDRESTAVKYDRISFYPTEVLKRKVVPNSDFLYEIPKPKLNKLNPFTLIKFDVYAIRREKRFGIFINRQREVVKRTNQWMFYEEYLTVFLKEFRIVKIDNIKFFLPSTVKMTPGFKGALRGKLEKKLKLDGVEGKEAQRQAAKEDLVKMIVTCAKRPNAGFDKLSLAYIHSVCRLEMFRAIYSNKQIITSVFVDEISVTERRKSFEKNKDWRTSWLKP